MSPAEADREWIFPSLQFTCAVNVTAWVFTVGAADTNIVCPTLELWRDNPFTLPSTDYKRTELLTPSSYTQPEALSESVYRCKLTVPLAVNAGTVLGFQTQSQGSSEIMSASNLQLQNSANAPVGYYRNIAQAATIFNTAQKSNVTGLLPLIAPETDTSSSTEIMTSSIISHLGPESTPIPLSTLSIPVLSTPTPTAVGENPSTDTSPQKKSAASLIVGIVVTTGILLLIVAIVLVVVIVLLARHRRQVSAEQGKATAENGTTVKDPMKTEIKRVRSKNNYTFTSSQIYEAVDGVTASLQRMTQQHDYDFIESVSIGPTGDPENYEIPQSSPSRTSSTPDNSLYEVPGNIVDQYDTPMNGPDPAKGGTMVEDCIYDTPIDVRGAIQGNASVGEGGYDTPVDTQVLATGNTEAEDSVYDTPLDVEPDGLESSDVYESV